MRTGLLSFLSIVFTSTAIAVCLHNPKTIQEEYQSSQCVLIAEVISKANISDSEGFWSHQEYRLLVINRLKGKCPETITILDENDSGKFYMEKGKQYVLFIDNLKAIDIDPCGNSGVVSEKQDMINQLKESIEPASRGYFAHSAAHLNFRCIK